MFEPIAIIGRACLLPGALNPTELWQNTLAKANCLSDATATNWGIDPQDILSENKSPATDKIWTSKIGCIKGFEKIFNPESFAISKDTILSLDVLSQWLLHAGREALHDAGFTLDKVAATKAGAVIGNLCYPTQLLTQFAESVWLSTQYPNFIANRPHPYNRFMSGLPINLMGQGLNLTAETFAIDAACASALYAIKLAADHLQSGKAEMMIAGGVNAADSLFLQMGFGALQALSKTGQSLPLNRQADGLIPAQGVALVVLKRLQDAVKAGDKIYAVIRGIGLSNDGRSRGFLVPSEPGQVQAMRQAYEMSGLKPEDISWVDCHATGTLLGDATEIRSMQQIFQQQSLAIGALKANIGHSITTSGAAALINTLSAFAAKIKPPTRLAAENPAPSLAQTNFRLLNEPEAWEITDKPRRAAINCFGFGGNNSHLLVEEWQPTTNYSFPAIQKSSGDIAVVGVGIIAGNAKNKKEFTNALFRHKNVMREFLPKTSGGYIDKIPLAVENTPFPPSDLQRTLGQQLALLKASQEALAEVKTINPQRTTVLGGMQCDAEIARCGLRWRLPTLINSSDQAMLATLRDAIQPAIQAADIVGNMPNIVSNRINQAFDFKGPSYSVAAEELSGITALQIGIESLQKNEIDCTVIGAVDMNCEIVHCTAANSVLPETQRIPGDAAVVLVLKRLEDAKRDGEKIYGIIPQQQNLSDQNSWLFDNNLIDLLFGHAHAASGLLQVAAATLACYEKLLPIGKADKPLPWVTPSLRTAQVNVTSLGNKSASVTVQEYKQTPTISFVANSKPKISVYSGNNKAEVLQACSMDNVNQNGPAKLVIVSHNSEELQHQKQIAKEFLSEHLSSLPKGMYFRERPMQGELAFVFTGAITTYANMGRELLITFPELLNDLSQQVMSLPEIIQHLYSADAKNELSMYEELKTYSLLTQAHAQFSQHILKLKPTAAIGYCSGESNALLALKAWRDMEQLFLDVAAAKIYTETLSGEFGVLDEKWNEGNTRAKKWVSWRLMMDVNAVKEAVKNETLVRLTIINSPKDCVIAGRPDACERLIKLLNPAQAKPLPHSMIIHCAEFAPVAKQWRDLHYRKTYSVPGVRFYSIGTGKSYTATADNAADALLSQAAATVDFPRVIRNAWDDGVRIFLEHGPRGLCSQWIDEILYGKEHLAIPLDLANVDPVTQAAYATAQLLAAGVEHIDYDRFK